MKNIAVSASGTVKLLTSSGSENSGKVATGNKVAVYDASGNPVSYTHLDVYKRQPL